jgi:uncharacterized membrane protein
MQINDKTKHVFSFIRNCIITGLFLVVPAIVTMWFIIFFFNFLTVWAEPIIVFFADHVPELHKVIKADYWFRLLARCFSLVIILTFLFLLGVLAKYTLGRRIGDMIEAIVLQMPVVKSIYSTIKQILNTIRSSNAGMFNKAVLFEYPKTDVYVIGFITNYNKGGSEMNAKTGKELISIFLPTTPNPTSGFLLFVPKEKCIFLDMDISVAMKLVISGGVISETGTLIADRKV